MNLGGEKRRFLCYNRPCFQYALKEGRPVQENNWEKTLEQLKQELKETVSYTHLTLPTIA